jgi:PD-(D/E)XK nuclease superfamily
MLETVKWSYTTVNAFRQCNRKFYFASILATHGRKDALRRKAYELKTMKNLLMWAGDVVDKFMEKTVIPLIVAKRDLDFAQLAEQAVKMAEAQFRFSKNGLYRDPALKKGESTDFCILEIHELNRPATEKELQQCFDDIRNGILNLPLIELPDGTPLIKFLKEANALTPNLQTWHVTIERANLRPQIDLLVLSKWKPVVIDWKLSASFSSDYSRQLVIAGILIYLKRQETTPEKPYGYKDVRLLEVNLLKGIVKEHEFNQEIVYDMIDYINLTSGDLFLLTKGNTYEGDIEDFEMTDEGSLCKSCNFQSLCSFLLSNKNIYDEKLYTQSIQAH